MKTSLFSILFFTLFFIFNTGANALVIRANNKAAAALEWDTINYNKVENIERDIPFNGERLLDVYYNKNDIENKKPVVIHIYGGYWITNSKISYTNIGSLLEESGYIAVLPNYILFPNGTIEDMVDDIYNAIQWTFKNISKYGGDPNQISISAHSSGAHLTALTIVKSALQISNNGIPLESLPSLKNVLLMNGPYIFDQEFLAYTLQGSSSTSDATITTDPGEQETLQGLMMTYYNHKEISPIEIIRNYENTTTISNHFNVEKFTFYYTGLDNVIPESSSKNLIKEILRVSNTRLEYVYDPEYEHGTIVEKIRNNNLEYGKEYLKLIKY